MFIQLSRFGNTFGDTEPVFVNPRQIECFYSFLDVLGGKEVMVTKVQFNQGFLLVKEDLGTIHSYIISAQRG
jgi:hypothetical protein